MPRSSRHKSHKHSKHSSRDYSDSEEDVVIKMKEKSSKDDGSTRSHRDSASGEKRKISSQLRETKDSKGSSGHGNGVVLEEYVSSKRRKEKIDAVIGGDRWNGGGDVEKESHKGEILKTEAKSKENIGKAESLRVESKSKSKRHDTGTCDERKEDNLVSAVAEKEESKSKGESKRKSERGSSSRKEGKESKEKDRRLEKEKNGGQESKVVDADVKLVDVDVGKKQAAQLVDLSGEKQCKRSRENNGKASKFTFGASCSFLICINLTNACQTEHTSMDELRNLELDKDVDKKIRRKKEGSSEREKYYDELNESDGRRLSSKGDRAKDSKHRDDRHKDGVYTEKYQEDGRKDDRRKDDKYREEAADKDTTHHNDKYREDGESDARRRDDKHREDADRDSRRKDEKLCDDGERDSRRKDLKHHDIEQEGQRDDKYHEDGDRDRRRKDDRNHEDGGKNIRRGDERYYEDGDRDDRRKDSSYRDGGDRDYRHKEEKYREDIDREKRPRDTKYRDERASKDRSGDKSDPKRSRDDGFVADHHVRKSSAYDDSPTRDDRIARYRDDQGRRRTNDKEEYGDIKSRDSKDQRTDFDKKGGSSARMDPVTDRVRSTSRNVDMELTSSHSRRRSSPTLSSHAPRDNYRSAKQDESKYRDYNYEDRSRRSMNSTRDYNGPVGGSDKTSSSRSLDKLGQKDDSNFADFSAERQLKPDTRSSPLQLVDKSPSTSADRRQFNRPDVRRNIDVDDSTQRSGGSRDWKVYSSKDVHPAEELVQADPDTQSISSPFARNSHFSNNSKSFPPPPPQFRTTVDSPLTLGSGEDDGRGKPNMRSSHRRMNEPNMGRMQGNNTWRGIPSWPSPIPNGFLPFPHAPPFHSVMQPFPASPMFGVRPSMELNHHPSPYHMSDPDRYPGPGRPMGWRNQVDDSQLHGWDPSSAVIGDESHIYGRSDWDYSRNMLGNRGWERSADLWKGPNRTTSVEMTPENENNNNSMLSGDEIQPPQNEQTRVDQQADSGDVVQPMNNFEKNEIWDLVGSEDSGIAKVSRKDDVPICNVYLSKLDISAELAETELFDKCACLIDADKIISPCIDDSKILYMEDVEAKMASVSHGLLSITLFASTDDSVFQKSMSLYKRHKESFSAEYGGKPKVSSNAIPNPNQEDQNVDVKTENLCPTDSIMQGPEDIKTETLQENIDPPTGDIITENPEEPVSNLVDLQMHDAEFKPLPEENVEGPAAPLGHVDVVPTGAAIKNEELELVDTKYGPMLNSVVSPEASEAMMPESVNLSRIHHSPESTH
ncbi:hypothetical protein CASFOL_002460 [Castilleja foliolosa]|uniref:Zinc finger CCCH domain-containing protein 13 n=1 Tax=Castilleja foliolosa TaxID=1961234 RepID=A0ABD3EHV4_9LAMI